MNEEKVLVDLTDAKGDVADSIPWYNRTFLCSKKLAEEMGWKIIEKVK